MYSHRDFGVVLCCVLLLILVPASPAEAQSAGSLPVIHNAAAIPSDVRSGDTMAVMANDISGSDPPPTINRYYTTWEDEVQTTSTDWVDPMPSAGFYPLKLTITPPAEGKYLVMACATLSNSSTDYYTDWQFLRETAGDTTEICRRQYKPRQVGDYVPFGTHNLMTLGHQEYTFRMQFRTSDASSTALMRHARIIIFRVEGYYHEVDEPVSSTTETTYQDKAILAFTPPTTGNYLIVSSVSITVNYTDKHFYARLTYDDVSQGEIVREPTVAGNYHSYQIMRVITLTNTPHTLKIQYRSEDKPTTTATIKNARISAVRLDDLGIDAHYTEVECASATTSTTYVDKATLTFSPSPSQYGDYLVMGFCLLNGNLTNYVAYAQLLIGNVSYGERSFRPDTSSDCIPLYAFKKYLTSPGSHTIKLQYKTEASSMAVTCQNARLLAIKVNTLESYSDAGITPCHTFDSSSHTVHIYSYGYQYNWEAETPTGMPYQVVYYDADGTRVYSHGIESNLNRSLTSSYNLRINPGAKAGTWHAVVYRAKASDPPPTTTYIPNDPNSIMEVEFTVEQSAITPLITTDGEEGIFYRTIRVNILGEISTLKTTYSGKLLQSYLISDVAGRCILHFDRGTRIITSEGKIPREIKVTQVAQPPPAGADMVVITAYDLTAYIYGSTPVAITFDPAAKLVMSYNPDELPQSISPPVIAYYDAAQGWIELEPLPGSTVEPGKVTALVSQTGTFAILARLAPSPLPPPPPPSPSLLPAHFVVSDLSIVPSQRKIWAPITFMVKTGEIVTITVNVTNDSEQEGSYIVNLKINGKTVDAKEVTLGAGQSQQITFTLSGMDYGQYKVEVAELSGEFTVSRAINRQLIAGIILVWLLLVM